MTHSNTRSTIARIAGALALTVALTGASSLAQAGSDVVIKNVTVGFGDLNLQTESDAQQLIARLKRAAISACGGKPAAVVPLVVHTQMKARFDACRANALQTAVTTVDRPLVTAAYASERPADSRIASR